MFTGVVDGCPLTPQHPQSHCESAPLPHLCMEEGLGGLPWLCLSKSTPSSGDISPKASPLPKMGLPPPLTPHLCTPGWLH